MDSEDQEDVRKLMSFDAESAGGIMTTEFIRIFAKNTVKDTLQFLQKNTDEETTYYLYVVDREDVLKGVVSLRDGGKWSSPVSSICIPSGLGLIHNHHAFFFFAASLYQKTRVSVYAAEGSE